MKNTILPMSTFGSVVFSAAFFFLPQSFATLNTEDLNPIHLGSVSDGQNGAHLSGAQDVFVNEGYAYVTARTSDALEIIDITDPLFPTPVGSITNGDGGAKLDGAWSVVVKDDYAYVASKNSDAIEIIDVSNKSNPTHVASLSDGDGGAELNAPISINIKENYAYVASYTSDALEIIDISNPLNPQHVSAVVNGQNGALLDGASDILIENNYVYIASQWSNALEIIDISDPENPVHVGGIAHPIFLRQARSVAIHGTYAFVTARSKLALQIIDISDKENPTIVASVGDGQNGAMLNDPNAIIIEGDLAFISSYRSKALEIMNVSDPLHPEHVAHLSDGAAGVNLAYPNALFYSGGLIYATSSYFPGVLEVISPTPTPDIIVSSTNYDFGTKAEEDTLTNTFTVTNTGFLDLEINSFVLVNETDFEITNNTCENQSVDVRGECTFDVSFIADDPGLKTGVIGILNNIEEKNPVIVQIQGTVLEGEGGNGAEGGGDDDDLPVNINDDNSITPLETVDMTVRTLGISITYGSGGPNIPVKLETKINNEIHTIFQGTEPQVASSDPLVINNIIEGTAIDFMGTSYNPYWPDWVIQHQTTEEDSPMIIALKNGDSVPDLTPYNQQPSIDEFLEGYINEEGIVTIGPRDIIYLFELGTGNPASSSADFQDGVLLVTFE